MANALDSEDAKDAALAVVEGYSECFSETFQNLAELEGIANECILKAVKESTDAKTDKTREK